MCACVTVCENVHARVCVDNAAEEEKKLQLTTRQNKYICIQWVVRDISFTVGPKGIFNFQKEFATERSVGS